MRFRKIIILFSFLFVLHGVNSQTNLVPNWSFEVLINCPQADIIPVYQTTPPWYSPTGGTSDIYNNCASSNDVGVPFNWLGYQQAHTGNGYGGFARNTEGNCEYLTVKLISPLKSGKIYCISFYVNPGNYTYYVIDRIGAYLSIDSIYVPTFAFLHYIPQVESSAGVIIADTINWTEVSGEYIATGGEQYITIGCFRPDSMVQLAYNDTINPPGAWPYYYLDDVSVYYCGPDTIEYPNEFAIPNAFTPNNDSYNDSFAIKGQNINYVTGKIFNRWGQELFSFSKPEDAWDGKYKGNDVSEGVYFYVVTVTFEDGVIQEKHGTIELIR